MCLISLIHYNFTFVHKLHLDLAKRVYNFQITGTRKESRDHVEAFMR